MNRYLSGVVVPPGGSLSQFAGSIMANSVADCTRLQAGDVVRVFGWCMLNKLEPGLYRVSKVKDGVYSFAKPKGSKVLIRHYAKNVDGWLRPADCSDLNKIVKIGSGIL